MFLNGADVLVVLGNILGKRLMVIPRVLTLDDNQRWFPQRGSLEWGTDPYSLTGQTTWYQDGRVRGRIG